MVTRDGLAIGAKDATLAGHQKVHRCWLQGVEGIVCSASLTVNLRKALYEPTCCKLHWQKVDTLPGTCTDSSGECDVP